jgi:hypothetical protein
MKRRDALIAIGTAVAEGLPGAGPGFRFFSVSEYEVVDQIGGTDYPSGRPLSRCTHDARVTRFIDLMVSHSGKDVQDQWRSGIRLVNEEASRRFGVSFRNALRRSRTKLSISWRATKRDRTARSSAFSGA